MVSPWENFFYANQSRTSIPNEVSLQIFSHLPVEDLVNLLVVCKRAKRIAITSFSDRPGRDILLHLAVRKKCLGFVRRLLEKEVDVNAQGTGGQTALIYAVQSSNQRILEYLLKRNADPEVSDNEGRTPLRIALEENKPKMVRCLIEFGADKDARLITNDHLLHRAVQLGCGEMVRLLLDEGVDVNIRGYSRKTPLIYAASEKNFEIVKLLLQRGADVNAVDEDGNTALSAVLERFLWAWERKRALNLLCYLLDHGANIRYCGLCSCTELPAVVRKYGADIVKILINAGLQIRVQSAG